MTRATPARRGLRGDPGPQGEVGPQGPAGPAGSGTIYWAVVQADPPSIVRGLHATGVVADSIHGFTFTVTFDVDVSACSYFATTTVGSSGSLASAEAGASADDVTVRTYAAGGTGLAHDFQVEAVC